MQQFNSPNETFVLDTRIDILEKGVFMDTQYIYDRNITFMTDLSKRYSLSYSLAEIMDMNSLHINFKEWTFRLFGMIRESVRDEKGHVKFKQVAIYHYSTKMINKAYMQAEIYKVREDFIRFNLYFNQVKSIKELESMENQMEIVVAMAANSMMKTLKK
jgi:hypothetical protein